MRKKRIIREAISDYISPDEIRKAKEMYGANASSFLSSLASMRRRGKQIDLDQFSDQFAQASGIRPREQTKERKAPPEKRRPDTSRLKKSKKPEQKKQPRSPSVDTSRLRRKSAPQVQKGTLFQQSPQVQQMVQAPQATQPPGYVPQPPQLNLAPAGPAQLPQIPSPVVQDPFAGVAPRSDVSDQRVPLPPVEQRRAQMGEQPHDPFQDELARKRRRKNVSQASLANTQRVVPEGTNKMQKKIKNILLYEVRRAKTKRILKEQIREQKKVQELAMYYLLEGPGTSVWQKIKDAGSSFMGGMMGKSAPQAQRAGATQVDDRRKQVIQAIEKAIKDAEAQSRKFKSEILKSVQLMSDYHDAVMNAYSVYSRFANSLGPAGMQLNRQINDMLEALEDDLMSEVSQIEAMFKAAKKKDVSLDDMLKKHKTRMGEKREKEADASARMASSYGVTDEKMPSKMRLPKVDVPFRGKDPDETDASLERIKGKDQDTLKHYEDQLKDVQDAFEQTSKDLFKRLMKTKDPEEKKGITRQMYDLTKSKLERERDLKKMMSGIGIRSKAGMTALRNARKGK